MSESEKGAEPVWAKDKGKMIEVLKQQELYEEGLSIEEMKNLLEALHESAKGIGNNNVNQIPEQIRQDNQPSHSRGYNSKNCGRGSMSPDLSGNQMRNSFSQDKRGEDESIYSLQSNRNSFSREHKDVQPANIINQHLSINEHFPDMIDKNNKSIQRTKSNMRHHEKPRYSFNPLDVCKTNVKDERLQQSIYRNLADKNSVESGNCVNIDEVLPQLMKHLQVNAILWHNQQGPSVRSKIPWGKAIQVDDTENPSEDKESDNDTSRPIAGPSGINFNVNNDRKRRSCARKIIDYNEDGNVNGYYSDDVPEDDTSNSEISTPTKRANSSEKANSNSEISKPTKRANSSEKPNSNSEISESTKRANLSEKANIPQHIIDYIKEQKACPRKTIDDTEDGKINGNSSDDIFEDDNSNSEISQSTKRGNSSEKPNIPQHIIDDMREKRNAAKNDSEKNEENEHMEEEKKNIKRKKLNEDAGSSQVENTTEDSDENVKQAAKKKKQTKSRVRPKEITSTRVKRQKTVEPSTSHEVEMEDDDDKPIFIENPKVHITISDSDESYEPCPKKEKNHIEDAVSSTSSSSYPRRIVPPNPKGKYFANGARKRLLDSNEQTPREKCPKANKQVNEEITRENQQKRNESEFSKSKNVEVRKNDREKKETPVTSDTEIRPAKISDRMKSQQEHLIKLRKEAEQLEIKRREEKRTKKMTYQEQLIAQVEMRLKAEKEKMRIREQKMKAKEAVEKRWTSLLAEKKKPHGERTELNPDGPRRNNEPPTILIEDICVDTRRQNNVERGDADRRNEKRVPCPICGETFMSTLIEDHAASCEEYKLATTPDASRSNSPAFSTKPATSMRRKDSTFMYECHICTSFSSNDGRIFEDHVNKCVTRHRDGVASGPSAVIEVPDSPMRNYRKVSDLADSEVNYKGQFGPKKISQTNDNRKRKRL